MESATPHLRRAWTTDGESRIRFESRSYATPPFGGARDPPHDEYVFDRLPHRAGRPPSLFRAAVSVLAAMQERRRDRAQQQTQEPQAQTREARPPPTRRSSSSYAEPERLRRDSTRDTSSPAEPSRRGSSREDTRRDSADDDTGTRRPAEIQRLDRQLRQLEEDVLDQEGEIDACSRWLSRHSHRDDVSSRRYDQMTRRLQDYTQHVRRTREEMKSIRLQRDQLLRERQRPRPRRRRTAPHPNTTPDAVPPELEEMLHFFFNSRPAAQRRESMPRSSAMPHAQLFEHIFAGMAGSHFAFTNARGQHFTQHFSSGGGTGPRFVPQSNPFAHQPSRQLKLLTTSEARQLYEQYNRRWTELGPTDPAVPYPGRELKSTALLATDSIHAPFVSSRVSAWSAEDVVRANTSYFFLALASFSPTFQDRAGKVEMDFDHSRAAPTQLQSLADMLKKEKLRWHSDKLGRRTGGQAGINLALQENEVARGVFHAVCHLSDLVQSKR